MYLIISDSGDGMQFCYAENLEQALMFLRRTAMNYIAKRLEDRSDILFDEQIAAYKTHHRHLEMYDPCDEPINWCKAFDEFYYYEIEHGWQDMILSLRQMKTPGVMTEL